MRSRLVVWYNTKCPVCDGGINWQRNRLVRAARAGAIEFRDINLEPTALASFGAGIEDVRRRLHAVDAEARRWYVAQSDVSGLRLEAADPATLLRRIEETAPELVELNADEVARRFGMKAGDSVRLTPVFDSPIELAA